MPAALGEIIENALPAEDEAASREIGTLHDLDDFGSCVCGFWTSAMVASMISREVVRRDIGRHANRDSRTNR